MDSPLLLVSLGVASLGAVGWVARRHEADARTWLAVAGAGVAICVLRAVGAIG